VLKDRVPRTYDPQVISELFRLVEAQLNGLTEGRAGVYHGAATAAPTTGDWVRGDWVKNSEPSAGGYFGWVCVTTGSAGTWKGFGTIQA
jgi:hypothetical protein